MIGYGTKSMKPNTITEHQSTIVQSNNLYTLPQRTDTTDFPGHHAALLAAHVNSQQTVVTARAV